VIFFKALVSSGATKKLIHINYTLNGLVLMYLSVGHSPLYCTCTGIFTPSLYFCLSYYPVFVKLLANMYTHHYTHDEKGCNDISIYCNIFCYNTIQLIMKINVFCNILCIANVCSSRVSLLAHRVGSGHGQFTFTQHLFFT